jgi:hypothetical protein
MNAVTRRLSPAEGVCRMALLEPQRIDIAHPTVAGARIVGYVIEPDELYGENEGLELLASLERVARVNWTRLRARLLTLTEG